MTTTALAPAMRHALRHVAQVVDHTPPSGAVVSAGELRGHVGQPLEDDDSKLAAIELAAQRYVETYLGRAVLTRTRVAWYDGPFCGPLLVLPEPATAIASLKVYDESDAESTVATTVYQADTISTPARLALRSGQSWPVNLRELHAIAVQYTDGWADGASVPANIRQAICLLVAHWYEHPQPVVVGESVADLPLAVAALLKPHRLRTGAA